jgi:hypothetical protein
VPLSSSVSSDLHQHPQVLNEGNLFDDLLPFSGANSRTSAITHEWPNVSVRSDQHGVPEPHSWGDFSLDAGLNLYSLPESQIEQFAESLPNVRVQPSDSGYKSLDNLCEDGKSEQFDWALYDNS